MDLSLPAAVTLLEQLLGSPQLDFETEALDCIANFDPEQWQIQTGISSDQQELFDSLVDKGCEGTMTVSDLEAFFALVTSEQPCHVAYSIYQAQQFVEKS